MIGFQTDRIAGLNGDTANGVSSLQLELNCKCEVQSFAFIGNYIVIDVFDGPELGPMDTVQSAQQWQPDSLPFIQLSNAPLRFSAFVMAQAPAQPHLLPDPPLPEETTHRATNGSAGIAGYGGRGGAG